MKHCYYQKQLPIQAERWYHMPIFRDSSTQEMKRRWKERNESAGKLYFWQSPVKKGQYVPDYANRSFHLASSRNQGRIQLATVWPYSAQHTCSEVKPLAFGAWTPMIRIKPYWHKTPDLTATPPLWETGSEFSTGLKRGKGVEAQHSRSSSGMHFLKRHEPHKNGCTFLHVLNGWEIHSTVINTAVYLEKVLMFPHGSGHGKGCSLWGLLGQWQKEITWNQTASWSSRWGWCGP